MKHLSMGSSIATDTHTPGRQAGDFCMANTNLQASPGPRVCKQHMTQQAKVWSHRHFEPNRRAVNIPVMRSYTHVPV